MSPVGAPSKPTRLKTQHTNAAQMNHRKRSSNFICDAPELLQGQAYRDVYRDAEGNPKTECSEDDVGIAYD